MLEGRSGMAEVAGELGTTPRTLRRALDREGTRFEAIRDEVRFAAARELLTLTSLPVGEIAVTLGFSTHGAFTEAFRRWSGTSPVAWRAERGKHSP
jgi:AraC-like DNA-binding protein